MRRKYLDRLIEMMTMDAVMIAPGEELMFFTGFSPMHCERYQGLFVKKDGTMFYICNSLYKGELEAAFGDACPILDWHDNEGMEKVYRILRENGLEGKQIGVGGTAYAFNTLDVAHALQIDFVNGKSLIEEVRIRKDHEELDIMRASAAIADSVYDPVCNFIRPGITEGDVRDFMLDIMRRQGGYEFDCIVASGLNSSYPHYSSFDRVIQEGDCIVLDWGCHYKELMSDTSRTVFVGSVTDEQREAYELVDRAQLAGEAAAKEGAFIPDVDIAARAVLDEKGLAHTLLNRVGHGIGYSVHEGPYINQINHRKLEKGMCFSIEPGVYRSGDYGIRIENIVCINESGETEPLNKTDRSLRILDWYKK